MLPSKVGSSLLEAKERVEGIGGFGSDDLAGLKCCWCVLNAGRDFEAARVGIVDGGLVLVSSCFFEPPSVLTLDDRV